MLSALNCLFFFFFFPPLNQPTAERRKKWNKYSEHGKKPETVSGQKTLGWLKCSDTNIEMFLHILSRLIFSLSLKTKSNYWASSRYVCAPAALITAHSGAAADCYWILWQFGVRTKLHLVRGMLLQGLHMGAQYLDVCVAVGRLWEGRARQLKKCHRQSSHLQGTFWAQNWKCLAEDGKHN